MPRRSFRCSRLPRHRNRNGITTETDTAITRPEATDLNYHTHQHCRIGRIVIKPGAYMLFENCEYSF